MYALIEAGEDAVHALIDAGEDAVYALIALQCTLSLLAQDS